MTETVDHGAYASGPHGSWESFALGLKEAHADWCNHPGARYFQDALMAQHSRMLASFTRLTPEQLVEHQRDTLAWERLIEMFQIITGQSAGLEDEAGRAARVQADNDRWSWNPLAGEVYAEAQRL